MCFACWFYFTLNMLASLLPCVKRRSAVKNVRFEKWFIPVCFSVCKAIFYVIKSYHFEIPWKSLDLKKQKFYMHGFYCARCTQSFSGFKPWKHLEIFENLCNTKIWLFVNLCAYAFFTLLSRGTAFATMINNLENCLLCVAQCPFSVESHVFVCTT